VEGQTHYLTYSYDFPGTTELRAGAFCGGSLNTSPIADAAADDTTGGGNDVLSTPEATYGLPGYLRERVHPGGITSATAGRMTPGDAVTLAADIAAEVASGGALTLAAINAILVGGTGGTANTDLDGAGGTSKSFGSVEDILRMLAGETYKTPQDTIICNLANEFRSEAERDALVGAQDTATTGKTFVSKGYFVVPGEPGYRNTHTYFQTGALNGSIGGGWLAAHKLSVTFRNPVFAYEASAVTPERLRAYAIDGTVIPTTGASPVVAIYDFDGNVL
jgi:hypothetical protein